MVSGVRYEVQIEIGMCEHPRPLGPGMCWCRWPSSAGEAGPVDWGGFCSMCPFAVPMDVCGTQGSRGCGRWWGVDSGLRLAGI